METEGLVSVVSKWLFGLPPDQVRWVHVFLALCMSSMVWGPPLLRVYWHVRRERFLLRATPEQLRAYAQDPPKPPSLGGPAAMVLGVIFAASLMRSGGAGLPSTESAGLGQAAQAQPSESTHTAPAPSQTLDPDNMACFPPGPPPRASESEESRTCCKGKCEPGSRCNERTCECEARALAPSSTLRLIEVGGAFTLIEAGDSLPPTDWEAGRLPAGDDR